jgi:hypothetical protein
MQTSFIFNLTSNDLCKIYVLVCMKNYLMPYWTGDMKICPIQKYHVYALGGHDISWLDKASCLPPIRASNLI